MFHSYFNEYAFDDIFNVLNPIDNSQKILLLYIYTVFNCSNQHFIIKRKVFRWKPKKSNQIFYWKGEII